MASTFTTSRFVKLHYTEAEFEPAGVPALLAYRNGDKFAGFVPVSDEIPDHEELSAKILTALLQRYVVFCSSHLGLIDVLLIKDTDIKFYRRGVLHLHCFVFISYYSTAFLTALGHGYQGARNGNGGGKRDTITNHNGRQLPQRLASCNTLTFSPSLPPLNGSSLYMSTAFQ